MKQEITSLYNEIAERNQTINEKVIIHLEFCEIRTKRNVEVYRVKIWTPLHKRDRHPKSDPS